MKIWLHLSAGIIWSGVGIMLIAFAAKWLALVHSWMVLLLILAGLLLDAGIYFFGFSKLASRNIHRIVNIPKERVCMFAFEKQTSYSLVLVMIALGIPAYLLPHPQNLPGDPVYRAGRQPVSVELPVLPPGIPQCQYIGICCQIQ